MFVALQGVQIALIFSSALHVAGARLKQVCALLKLCYLLQAQLIQLSFPSIAPILLKLMLILLDNFEIVRMG